jgi:hypothetical protein
VPQPQEAPLADLSNTSSPIPVIHQHNIADVIESEENRSVLANVVRRVLLGKQEILSAFQSATAEREPRG